jgi:ATP-binding cassette subfamily A (ABC1) protein 3
MLTGMLKPSKGQAQVYNQDIFKGGLDYIRKFMGVCPQHDILFDLLTPEEHLSVFIDFKGNDDGAISKKAEIDELIENVGLNEYRNTMAKNLSGGSKRKLSVAIALCGNSKFILLDEPTSGMDL